MILNFLPLYDEVTLEKSGGTDEWGIETSGKNTPKKLKARVRYNTKNESISLVSGETITFKATILLEGLPDVGYEDYIRWVDDFGKEHKRKPIEVDYIQDMSGDSVAVKVVL